MKDPYMNDAQDNQVPNSPPNKNPKYTTITTTHKAWSL